MAEVVNLVGMTSSLGQLAAILERVTLLVSNDSAPVHIADAMGTRTIVLTKPNSKKSLALGTVDIRFLVDASVIGI